MIKDLPSKQLKMVDDMLTGHRQCWAARRSDDDAHDYDEYDDCDDNDGDDNDGDDNDDQRPCN